MTPKEKNQLGFPAWKPTTGWFHIFKHMIESGDASMIKGNAFLVYAVIKSHINPQKGIAFPEMDTIAQKAGCTPKSVRTALEKLEKFGYVRCLRRDGKPNQYTLIEKVQFEGKDEDGEIQPMRATWDYVPIGVSKAVQDIKNVMISGVLPEGSSVRIENLTINMQLLPKATTANQVNLSDIKDKDLRELIKRALERGIDD